MQACSLEPNKIDRTEYEESICKMTASLKITEIIVDANMNDIVFSPVRLYAPLFIRVAGGCGT